MIITLRNIFVDMYIYFCNHILTTNGEGEHARQSRKVAAKPQTEKAGLGGMKAVAIRWAEQEAAPKARKRPGKSVRIQTSRGGSAGWRYGDGEKSGASGHGKTEIPAGSLARSNNQRQQLSYLTSP